MKPIKSINTVLVVILLVLVGSSVSLAQYNTSLGVRAGGTTGITIKHFYAPSTAVEGIVGFFGNGFSITGLIEKHQRAFDAKGLSWYYGPGLHVAYYNRGYPENKWRDIGYRDESALGFGINGILGLEYRLPDNIPIAISLDLKPFLEIDTRGNAGVAIDPGLGIKFILD